MTDIDQQASTIIHLAGQAIQFEALQRQRCLWCGFVLVDDDLSRMAFQIPPCRYCGEPYSEHPGPCEKSPDDQHLAEEIQPPNGRDRHPDFGQPEPDPVDV